MCQVKNDRVLKFVLSSGICLSDRDMDIMEGHLRKQQESTTPKDEDS